MRLEKQWRFSLGVSAENSLLSCLDNIQMARVSPKPLKLGYLTRASGQLESTRLKARLILELKLANETNVFQLQKQLVEIGRMLGGWIKSVS